MENQFFYPYRYRYRGCVKIQSIEISNLNHYITDLVFGFEYSLHQGEIQPEPRAHALPWSPLWGGGGGCKETSHCIFCLVPVRRFPRPPRSIHFGDVSEANGWETHATRQELAARNNEAQGLGNVYSSFRSTFLQINIVCSVEVVSSLTLFTKSMWTSRTRL